MARGFDVHLTILLTGKPERDVPRGHASTSNGVRADVDADEPELSKPVRGGRSGQPASGTAEPTARPELPQPEDRRQAQDWLRVLHQVHRTARRPRSILALRQRLLRRQGRASNARDFGDPFGVSM